MPADEPTKTAADASEDLRAADAELACVLFAVDPAGLKGVALRASAGPQRQRWLARLEALLPDAAPLRRVPLHISDERLLGGLDLAATLQAGRPVGQRGVLAEADGGVLVLAMAERLAPATAARVAAVLDTNEIVTERDAFSERRPSRIGVVALDEGIDADEALAPRLLERLAFHVALDGIAAAPWSAWTRADVAAARARLGRAAPNAAVIEALCATALALGVASVRAPWLAWRTACAAAALEGVDAVDDSHAALAARLVLAPRATRLPAAPEVAGADPAESGAAEPEADEAWADDAEPAEAGNAEPDAYPAPHADPPDPDANAEAPDPAVPGSPVSDAHLDDLVLDAAVAAIPPGLLATLTHAALAAASSRTAGRVGALQKNALRGRPGGARRGEPRGGARLNLIETLRAAAPWQALRRAESAARGLAPKRIEVRRADFHLTRFRQRSETTTLFVVDASGSAALHRLAETKGAVELLLADCYVRRDSVAVLAFRGRGAEVLLPPTRSLVRAKRSLAGLPGGGGTPLAAGIDAACALADGVRRRGSLPVVVLLTDGRANIARNGSPGRQQAGDDALAAARALRACGFTALLLDTSPQPQPAAARLAGEMGAAYLPLPHAGAEALSQAVRAAGGHAAEARRA